jgi:hypothetical protein
MKTISNFAVICCLVSLSTLIGCGNEESKMVPVSGKVTIGGKPVTKSGLDVLFTSSEGGKPASFEVSSDGTFSGEAPAGKCEVTLSSSSYGGAHGEEKTGNAGPPVKEVTYESLKGIDVAADAELTLDFKKKAN